MTSDQRRHRSVSERLANHLDLAGIVAETKRAKVEDRSTIDDEDAHVIEEHFRERDEVEKNLLGDPTMPEVPVLEVETGGSNSQACYEWVLERDPDVLLLYGTSIIRDPLASRFEDRMINLHLGLSPYFRGAGTNFWPLVEGLPELVGATVHLATDDVDAGPILTQVRPDPEPGDRVHEIGTKAILEGAEAMGRVVAPYLAGEIEPVPQRADQGRVYKRADFDADAVRQLWANLDDGMVAEYIENLERRRKDYPIVDNLQGEPA